MKITLDKKDYETEGDRRISRYQTNPTFRNTQRKHSREGLRRKKGIEPKTLDNANQIIEEVVQREIPLLRHDASGFVGNFIHRHDVARVLGYTAKHFERMVAARTVPPPIIRDNKRTGYTEGEVRLMVRIIGHHYETKYYLGPTDTDTVRLLQAGLANYRRKHNLLEVSLR